MNDDSLWLASGVLLLRRTVSAGSLAAVSKETGLEGTSEQISFLGTQLTSTAHSLIDRPEREGSMGTDNCMYCSQSVCQ